MSTKKPNIVFLFNDHQAYYGHGKMAGGPKIRRPNFEKLAASGAIFTRAYTCCPLCGPARRSVLTGLFPHNHGEIKNNTNHKFDREIYLELLAEAGYKNYYYGKWHAGPGSAYDHKCEGFSYRSYGNPYTKPEYKKYVQRKNLPHFQVHIQRVLWKPKGFMARYFRLKEGKLFTPRVAWCNEHAIGIMTTPKETHEAFFLANLACDKLREIAKEGNKQPFHLRVDFWGPHQPYYATQEFLDMYNPDEIPEYPNFRDDLKNKPESYKSDHNYPISKKGKLILPSLLSWPEWQQILHFNYAQQTLIDQAGGLILDTLNEVGLMDNTLVVWSTDHGDGVACHGGHFDKDFYLPEEMMRIPMAISYPGVMPSGQKSEKLVSNLDLPATFVDAAGVSFTNTVDGQSLLPLCTNPNIPWREDLMCETHGHFRKYLGRLIITDRYKYIWNYGDMDELYDLKEDPWEMNNLINDKNHAEVLADMKNRLKKWKRQSGDVVEMRMIKPRLLGITHKLDFKEIRKILEN